MKNIRSPIEIANSMNRMFIKQVKETIKNIPKTDVDPLEHFKDKIKTPEKKLNLKQINMSKCRKLITKMKNTGSSTSEQISMITTKKLEKHQNPYTSTL